MNDDTITLTTNKDGVTFSVGLPKKCVVGSDYVDLRRRKPSQAASTLFQLSGRFESSRLIFSIRAERCSRHSVRFLHRRVPGGQNPTRELLPGERNVVVIPLGRLRDLTVADTTKITIRRDFDEDKGRPIQLVIKDIELRVEEHKD